MPWHARVAMTSLLIAFHFPSMMPAQEQPNPTQEIENAIKNQLVPLGYTAASSANREKLAIGELINKASQMPIDKKKTEGTYRTQLEKDRKLAELNLRLERADSSFPKWVEPTVPSIVSRAPGDMEGYVLRVGTSKSLGSIEFFEATEDNIVHAFVRPIRGTEFLIAFCYVPDDIWKRVKARDTLSFNVFVHGEKTYKSAGGENTIKMAYFLRDERFRDAYEKLVPESDRSTQSPRVQSRTWKSRDGKYSIQGYATEADNVRVNIVVNDGSSKQVEIQKLSQEDTEYIRAFRESLKPEATVEVSR